jgi:hypothetical protein
VGAYGRPGSLLLALALSGCAASLSPIEGAYVGPPARAAAGRPVTLEFVVTHLEQSHGWDVVPKHRPSVVEAFDEILRDAVVELGPVSSYSLTTDTGPAGQSQVVTQREFSSERDFAIHLAFLRESSFAAHTFYALVAIGTLGLCPVPFSWQYTVEADVYDRGGRAAGSYRRSAEVTNWVQDALAVVYPFHPLEGKEEKLYSLVLHDLFREIGAKGVVAAPTADP